MTKPFITSVTLLKLCSLTLFRFVRPILIPTTIILFYTYLIYQYTENKDIITIYTMISIHILYTLYRMHYQYRQDNKLKHFADDFHEGK